ncbi:L,D-transpeptidase family protein [Gaoshiqia sp. Z1-71]|uniref:L,D-transpeptidase family protein n=1 Tax=Gaoshiqia hydrogeniformans TaxID=3290090 RepID=UPI003BF7C221
MGKKRWKKVGWGITVFIILFLGGWLVISQAPQAPREELKLARESLNAAQKAGAAKNAAAVYNEAQQLYDSAMVCWAVQNKRFFLVRDFSTVSDLCGQVISRAREAGEKSVKHTQSTNKLLKNGLANLDQQVSRFDRLYKKLPLPENVITAYNNGKMKLSEAKIAFGSNRNNEAQQHWKEAEKLIGEANRKAERLLADWFIHYPQWKKYGAEAIRLSKSGQRVILVDKLAHSCMVYQNGKIVKQFEAELGKNWIGDKRKKGDKATPEGLYRVTRKKDRFHTKFHRALLLNYPNDDDKKRFAEEKKKGSIPAGSDIGGLIEIHGHGGKGVDWTDGCVALTNDDMDSLFRLVAAGTPVIIVGSLKSLQEIYGRN